MQILPNGLVRITNSATKETKDVRPEELDSYSPGLYGQYKSLTGQTTPTPPVAQTTPPVAQTSNPEAMVRSPDFTEKLGRGILGFGQSLIQPSINYVTSTQERLKKQGGLKPEDYVLSALGPGAQALLKRKEEGGFEINKEGLKATANIASFMVPFGEGTNVVSKALLPGAAVGGLQAASEKETSLPKIFKGAGVGAVSSGLLYGAGKLLKGTSKLAGKGLEKTSEKLATKSLRPSPSQQANFLKETGEKIPEFLKKRGLEGADYEVIDKATDTLQKGFDSIATSENLVIDANNILSSFGDEITKLNKSIIPADRQKAKVLEQVASNFIENYGDKPLNSNVITSLRREIDKGITDFALDPAVKSPLNLVRDIFQNSIRESADKAGLMVEGNTLKQTGVELSKLYKLQEIAERQQFLGQGSMSLGITTLLGGIAGAKGGLPGIVGGAIATNLINRPQTAGITSKITGGIAGGLERFGAKPAGISTVVGQAVSRLPSIIGRDKEQVQKNDNQKQTNQLQHILSPISDTISQPVKYLNPYGLSPEELYTKAIEARDVYGDTKAYNERMQMYKDETAYQKTQGTTKETQTKQQIQNTVEEMKRLYGLGTKDSLSLGASSVGISGLAAKGTLAYKKSMDQSFNDRLVAYKQMAAMGVGILNMARGAGTLNAGEFDVMMGNIPSENSTENQAKEWFNNINSIISKLPLEAIMSQPGNTLPDITQ